METYSCYLCSHNSFELVGEHPDFHGSHIVVCNDCGFISTFPCPGSEELTDGYKIQYRKKWDKNNYETYGKLTDVRAMSQMHYLQKHCHFKFDDKNVMDIGFSSGAFLVQFSNYTRNISGFEPDLNMYNYAKSRLPVSAKLYNSEYRRETLGDNKYDIVIMSHVVEHLIDPIRVIKSILEILGEAGVVFFELPNDNKGSVKDLVSSNHEGSFHLHYFNVKTFQETIRKAGGEIINVTTYGPHRWFYSKDTNRRGMGVRKLIKYSIRKINKASGTIGLDYRMKNMGEIVESDFFQERRTAGIWIRSIIKKH